MKNDINTLENSSIFSSRESLLKANAELIGSLQKRINVKRFRFQEGDNIKLSYMRIFLQALQIQNVILKDLELENIKERLEVLEAMQVGSQAEEEGNNSDFGSPWSENVSDQEDEYEIDNTWS
jgi:hypothetical protein